jgi:plastocyanin
MILALALGGAACGKKEKKSKKRDTAAQGGGAAGGGAAAGGDTMPDPNAGGGAAAAGGSGTIAGKVDFTGTAPEMPKLKREADPFCAKTEMTAETVLVNENKTLRNVLVRIKPGTVKGPAPTEPIKIEQHDCMYRPRVQGAVAEQEITIHNGDQTTHNVHAFDVRTAENNAEESLFNLAQPKGAAEITKDANGYDLMKFKCDVHPWMLGYVVVNDHPYFAVTGEDGSFKIEGVPAGKYTLEAWHEHYGVKTAEVEVADKGSAEATFAYDGTEKAL